MSIDELLQIIKTEQLDTPILYSDKGYSSDSVTLERNGEMWRAFITSERAWPIDKTIRTFDNEPEALEYVLLKLRQSKKLNDSLALIDKQRKAQPKPTHIQEVNGTARGALLEGNRSYSDKIRLALEQMNGDSFWGYRLWRGPKGVDLLKETPSPVEFIQCFGSADAMTIQVRTLDSQNSTNAYQFILGHKGKYVGKPSSLLVWNNGLESMNVYSEELFTAEEAAAILFLYFQTEGVSDTYHLREMSVTENATTNPETYDVTDTDVPAERLNRAIIVYLGKSSSSYPQSNVSAVKELTSSDEAGELLSTVELIVNGSMSVEIDWSTHSLSEAGNEVKRVMAARYPQLNEAALDALSWAFTYNNK